MAFLKLKKTSRIAKAIGRTTIGNRMADPASSIDTRRDELGHTFKPGDDVTAVLGDYKGKRGRVVWIGYADRGGAPRARVQPAKGEAFFCDQSQIMLSIDAATRFK